MKKLYTSLSMAGVLVCCLLLHWTPRTAQAQTRYLDEVFTEVNRETNVVYGSNIPFASNEPIDLKMDIYTPVGDTETDRPLIIWAHGGSFLPPGPPFQSLNPLGSKVDTPMVKLCQHFARRGYVAVAIEYRTGWNPLAQTDSARAEGIIQAAWRAFSDGKACVRYFRRDVAENGNTYNIDPNRIAFGGSQAGAYLPLHMIFLDKPEELLIDKLVRPVSRVPFIDANANGGFEGNSGNPGFSSEIQVGISLGGALADTSFIEGGEVPILAMHGTQDPVTPYMTEIVVPAATGLPVIEVSGAYDFIRVATAKGNQAPLLPEYDDDPFPGLYPFYGAGFQPYAWYSDSDAQEIQAGQAYLDTTLNFLAPRLFKLLNLDDLVSRDKLRPAEDLFRIYPNPADEALHIISPAGATPISRLNIVDLQGRTVLTQTYDAPQSRINLNLEAYPPGLYVLQLETSIGPAIRKIQIR